MKKKICIGGCIVLIMLMFAGIITNYADSGRVTTGHEPKYCIKVISNDGSKVTYLGLGYKVIRYVGVSPNEPYENNIGVKMGNWFMKYKLSKTDIIEIEYEGKKVTVTDIKMGNWFMKYELPKTESIEIEYEGQTITITNIKDIGSIQNILVNSKYNSEICKGINTHKITMDNEIYYLKESCKEIQKGDKQAKISKKDLDTILKIIDNKQ